MAMQTIGGNQLQQQQPQHLQEMTGANAGDINQVVGECSQPMGNVGGALTHF